MNPGRVTSNIPSSELKLEALLLPSSFGPWSFSQSAGILSSKRLVRNHLLAFSVLLLGEKHILEMYSTGTSMGTRITNGACIYIQKHIQNSLIPLLVSSFGVLDEGECQEVCSQRSPDILRRRRCLSTFYLWILWVRRTFKGDSSLFQWMILDFIETWKRHQGNRQNWNCIPKTPGRQRPAFRVQGDKKLSNHICARGSKSRWAERYWSMLEHVEAN